MQRIKKNLSYLLLILCFTASFLCFDDFKTDDLMFLSGAANATSPFYTTGCIISNEDMCTVEMLRNTSTRLLNHQTAVRNSQIRRKSDTQFGRQIDILSLQSPFHFFTFVVPFIVTYSGNTAKIINFIHHKDGKKRI